MTPYPLIQEKRALIERPYISEIAYERKLSNDGTSGVTLGDSRVHKKDTLEKRPHSRRCVALRLQRKANARRRRRDYGLWPNEARRLQPAGARKVLAAVLARRRQQRWRSAAKRTRRALGLRRQRSQSLDQRGTAIHAAIRRGLQGDASTG